jgi:two-component system phosphate regulon sensor histidine kinase PhoR
MEFRHIRIIIGIVGAALLGLIGIQFFWAYNAYRLNEKTFLSNVSGAMSRTVTIMNDNLECFELFSKVHINSKEGFYMVRQKCSDNESFISGKDAIDTVPMFFAKANKYLPFDYNNLMFSTAVNLEMTLRFRYLMDDSSALDNSVNQRKEITQNNFREKFSDKQPIAIRYDTLMLDSILKHELGLLSINQPFHFAYRNKTTGKIEFASAGGNPDKLLSSPLHIQLSSDKYFSRPYELIVLFPKYSTIIFAGIKTMFIFSVIIILLLLISFYVFIRIILHQRKLSELKNDFINNMTHEFKTPLSNISVALETLTDENLRKTIPDKNILQIIGQENERLRENVEKILHVARFEKEKIHLSFERLDTSQVIQKAASSFDALLNNNGVSLKYIFKADDPFICADETHLINVICNLIDNSIKYSNSHCEIVIGTSNKKEGVVISVKDNGIGLSKEAQKKIFEKFYREPNGNLHNVKGFGLGLTYVKSIVDAHHGNISVNSRPGVETSFEIYFPFNHGAK